MSIHNLAARSQPVSLIEGITSATNSRCGPEASAARECRDAQVREAAAEAITVVAEGLDPRTEDFQRAVPRFKIEIARIVSDYAPAEMSMALAIYIGERERRLATLTTLDRLTGRSGAEFLPKGTLRSVLERAAEAGDAEALELLASGRPVPFID
jgi:hypothetical protein